ncbi:MAG: HD domain-containing phosphohydrolase [bacterium]
MKVWWPGAAIAAAVVSVGMLNAAHFAVPRLAIAGAGSGAVVLATGAILVGRRRKNSDELPDGGLTQAVRAWDGGEHNAMQAWVTDLVGQEAAAHATRTASLCQLMAEQLAVPPDNVDQLMLAALAHVAPAAFETGEWRCTAFSREALALAQSAVLRSGNEDAARIMGQVGERWDGRGSPDGLLGEAASLRGRILATACAFDQASASGLEPGLAAIREGSGSIFDPVVAAELLHLFKEPWQLRQAA